MRTQILTKDLLKIINPSKDGIHYQGQTFLIDLKELKKYVEHPKQNDVFKASGDLTIDLYKNLALYIINSEDSPNLIFVDLNNPIVFEPNLGLFEYIKNIYNKEEKSYINIDENGDNLFLIKSKKLEPLPNDFLIQNAQDIHSTVSSFFSDTTKLDLSKINQDTWQFNWQEELGDNYSNLQYIVGKVEEIFKYHNNKEGKIIWNKEAQTTPEEEFYKLLDISNQELIQSDAFKLALMDVNSSTLKKFLADIHETKNQQNFSIDFSQSIFQSKLLEQVTKNDMIILEALFENYLDKINNKYQDYSRLKEEKDIKPPIDLNLFINLPETINYLVDKQFYGSYGISADNTDFTIVSCYSYFTEENKRDKKNIDKYLFLITSKNSIRDTYIDQTIFLKLPADVINEPSVISCVSKELSFYELKRSFEQNNIDCPNYSSKNIIISNANRLGPHRLREWVCEFIPKTEIDKNFINNLVAIQPQFYEQLKNSLHNFAKDWDIISSAIKGGYNIKSISSDIMKSLLLEDSTPEQEELKIRYLIERRIIGDMGYLFDNPKDIEKAKAKFHKPEYLFYKIDDSSYYEFTGAKKVLSKFKSREEIFEILDKIKNNSWGYKFNSNHFYDSLSTSLKKDKDIASRILDMGCIKYTSLDEHLAYNCDIVIKCLKKTPKEVKHIPNELFSNSKFSINFAKLIDQGCFEKTDIPNFVSKFFDNQGVTEKYEDYLNTYISYKKLQTNLEKTTKVEPTAQPRKMKI